MTDVLDRLSAALRDRYRFERVVGTGGMATVYLAHDLKHRRQVAVKVLRAELAEAMGAERFRREIEIAAGLHHPHILPLFDSGEADGLLFYVMPFEEGETLRGRLRRDGQLTIPAATRLMRDVADALAHAHAHARGVVHRDIKPENVLCSGQHALVTDFGIAKALSGDGADDDVAVTTLTQAGTSLGTPAYMAPEQVAGDPNTDHRADIYALGIMTYEALAGSAPFSGTSAQQILAAHLAQAPEPLGARRADVPPALAAIIMRCLEKEPTARWQSAAEIVAALEGLSDTGGHAVATPRRRWPLVAAALAVILAVAGTMWVKAEGRFGTLIGKDVLAADDLVMVAEFANRTPDSTLAATVTDAVRIELQESPVVGILSQGDMWDGMRQMTLEPGSALPDAKVRELAERVGAKAFVVGDVAPLGGGYQLTARVLATVDGAEALTVRTTANDAAGLIEAVGELGRKLRRGIGESLRSVAAAPTLERATTASLPALRAYTAGNRAEDGGDRPRAIELLTQATALDSTFANAWAALGVAHINSGRWPEATAAMTRAYRWREGLPEDSRLSIETNYHIFRGETDLAEPILRRRTELSDKGWVSYADLLLGQGRLAAAESAAVRGILTDPKTPVAYWNLVEAQVAQQKYAAADSTIARFDSVVPNNRWRLIMESRILEARRDLDGAEAYYREGRGTALPGAAENMGCLHDLLQGELADWKACSAPEAGEPGNPHLALAELRLTGDTVRARAQLRQIADVGLDSTDVFSIPMLIALQAESGDVAGARKTLSEWRGRTSGDDPRYRANSSYALGAIALAEGKLDSAATAFLAWNRSAHLDAGHWYNRGLVEAGMALDRAGKADSARALYEKALSMPSISGGLYYETTWYPEVLRRLGEIAESRGERATALEYYGTLLDLWKNADPVLQPQVRAVRARVAALAGEGRP
jgi:serine/threonine-protein kinase